MIRKPRNGRLEMYSPLSVRKRKPVFKRVEYVLIAKKISNKILLIPYSLLVFLEIGVSCGMAHAFLPSVASLGKGYE
jgi:hypothetical protein